jgi:hypothetical protein
MGTKTLVKCGVETYNLSNRHDFRGTLENSTPVPAQETSIDGIRNAASTLCPFRFTPRLSVALGWAEPYWSIGQIVSRAHTCTYTRRCAPQVVTLHLRREFDGGSLRSDRGIDFISRIAVRMLTSGQAGAQQAPPYRG